MTKTSHIAWKANYFLIHKSTNKKIYDIFFVISYFFIFSWSRYSMQITTKNCTTHHIARKHFVTWYSCVGLARTGMFYLQDLVVCHLEDCQNSQSSMISFLNPIKTIPPNGFLYSRVWYSCVPCCHLYQTLCFLN